MKVLSVLQSAKMIETDSEHRFVTDAEKHIWNNAGGVPKGVIVMWSGTIVTIPSGWALCNGGNGTPNLSDRFVRGTVVQASMNTTGGADTHVLTLAQLASHTHTGSAVAAGAHQHTKAENRSGMIDSSYNTAHGGNTSTYYAGNSAGNHGHTISINAAGSGQAHNNIPAYYALAYIMKL